MLITTFSNVSCAMDGSYRLALMNQVAAGPEEYKSTSGYLQVTSLSGKPTLSLNADQVIDLVFPDGSYFRSTGTHTCEGRIGQYHSNLEIDITYDNGKSYQHIPTESIDLSRKNTSDECSTNQTVIFGLRFSSEMNSARLRCRVSDRIDEFTLSEEFSLIPRNICNCGASWSYRGHPNNCKVQVYCIADDGITYPTGIACPPSQCRNSLTGVCSSDCSDTVCNEAVPSDFCTTPVTPTTTPSVPTVTVLSNYYQVTLGDTVTLVCQVMATPKHSLVQWTKMVNGQTTNINMGTENNKYSGSTVNGPSLTISAAANSDEGYYTCTATNVDGTGTSQQTYLDVTGSVPTVTVHSNSYQVTLGYTVTLVCQVVATPKHTSVQWKRVVNGQTTNIYMGTENNKYSGSTVNVSSLTISVAANSDEGYYICSATNVVGTGVSQQTYLDVTGCATEKLTITLNADQVIDLIFPDGNYYRDSNTHKCEGRIGQPPSKLEIDITYDNGTSFQQISNESIVFYRTTFSDECSTKETLAFGLRFSSQMVGAKLRCRVSFRNNDFTLSEELRLIPRNICNCGLSHSYRAHPSNCKVQVLCIEEAGIMYPSGIACPTNECRNSRTGSCSNDCSEIVCNEAVSSDFCTTTAPSTTTLLSSTCKPSEDVNLQLHPDQIAGLGNYRSWLLHTCEINVGYPPGEIRIEILKPGDTEFSNLNVNFEAVTDTFGNTTCSVTRTVAFGIAFTSEMDKATIRCGVKHELLPNDQLVYSNNETVSLIPFDFCQNYTEKTSYHPHPTNCHNFVQCQNGLPYAGICPANSCFGVAETNSCDHCYLVTCPTDITTTSRHETTVPVPSIDFPGKPVLKLSVDQVIDLGFYRDRSVHSCAGIIGNPMRELILEIAYVNTKEYTEIPGSILRDLQRNKSTTERQNYEQIQFGLLFSSEMKDSKVRCRPSGNINNRTIAEESLALIPRDICSCGDSGDYRGHPGRCDSYVVCLAADNIMYPYGLACPDGQCRNSLTGICSTDCSGAVCNEGVPADFCTTTPMPTTTSVPLKPSVEVSCNGSSIAVNAGPVNVVCYFNETIYRHINITFTMQNETTSRPVANIEASGNVIMIDQRPNRVIEADVNFIKIKTLIASCDSGGKYRVTVDTGGTPGFDDGILEILTKPGKPSIDQQLHTVEGNTVIYTCTGNVGNPPGYIEFLVRKNGEENFTVSSIASTSSQVTPNNNCNNEQTFYHEHIATSDWNRTTIKCRAVNQRTITENDDTNSYISNEEEMVLIQADYCVSSKKEYKAHPRGCNYYVRCVNSAPYTQPCGRTLCFSDVDNSQPCVFCYNARPPCNATSS